jgi:BirA family biotin operon repressor/biotin-[acetyl-CoA-carboxylase] ligase
VAEFHSSAFYLEFHPTLPSTNDRARHLPHRSVVVADIQTAGRGRDGRAWVSLLGNLHASLILDRGTIETPLQMAAAILVTLEQLRQPITYKWPNDVLLGGAKVCGILPETTADERMVIGFGINIVGAPEGHAHLASSERDTLLHSILANFEHMEALPAPALHSILSRRLDRTPKAVRIGKQQLTGHIIGLGEDFSLLFHDGARLRHLMIGEVLLPQLTPQIPAD